MYWKGKFLSACLQDYLESVNPDVFIEEDAVELATLVFANDNSVNEMLVYFT